MIDPIRLNYLSVSGNVCYDNLLEFDGHRVPAKITIDFGIYHVEALDKYRIANLKDDALWKQMVFKEAILKIDLYKRIAVQCCVSKVRRINPHHGERLAC